MDSNKPSFEKDLWGQCNILHERLNKKIEYYKNLKKVFEPIHNAFSELNKKISAVKIAMDTTIPVELYEDLKTTPSNTDETGSKFYGVPLTMKIIKDFVLNSVDFNVQTLFHIVTNLENLIKKMKQEKNEFDEFQRSLLAFYEGKRVMDKNKKLYHQKMIVAEQSVLDLKKLEIKTMSVNNDSALILQSQEMLTQNATKFLNDCIKPFKTYEESRSKANELREDSVKKQKHLLFTYQEMEEDEGKLNLTIINLFSSNLKIQKEFIEEKSKEIDGIKNATNVNKDIKQLIIKFTGHEQPEEEIPFCGFPTTIDFDKSDKETFLIYSQAVKFIQDKINLEFPNYNEQLEKEKNDMREIMYKIFSDYTKEGADKLLKFIQNPEIHYYFLLLLNNLRTNNRIKQNKELIDLLGIILNQILDESEKSLTFDNAKNCMILSQTFYCENGPNNEKYYLIEKIRKHKWLNSNEFWVSFIDKMIDIEINKFVEVNNDVTKEKIINGTDNVNDKVKAKVSELLFSQLLPYVNNMNEFKLNVKNIVQITDYFCTKFKYLSDEHKESMFGIIEGKEAEISRYRKEFEKKNSLYEKRKNQEPKIVSKKENVKENKNDNKMNNKADDNKNSNKKEKKKEKEEKKERKKKTSVVYANNRGITLVHKKRDSQVSTSKDLNISNLPASNTIVEPKIKPKEEDTRKKEHSVSSRKKKSHFDGGFFGSILHVKNKVVNVFKKDEKNGGKEEKKDEKEAKKEEKKEEKKEQKKEEKKEDKIEAKNQNKQDPKKDQNFKKDIKPIKKSTMPNSHFSNQSNHQPSPFGVVLKKIPNSNNN